MSLKPEIQTSSELLSFSNQTGLPSPTGESSMRVPLLYNFQVRTLTGPCAWTPATTASVLLNHSGKMTDQLAVRGRPSPNRGLRIFGGDDEDLEFNSSFFMEPLRDFLDRVKNQKFGTGPHESLDELALALFFGDLVEVERLLTMIADLDSHTSDLYGFAPLHWAVVGGYKESIDALLDNGVSPLSVTREGWTAMHVSALFNKLAWKTIFAHNLPDENLAKLAENRTKDHLETPLHLAAAYTSSDPDGLSFFWNLYKDLISHTTISVQNAYDETPLHRAAACNNAGIIHAIVTQSNYSRPTVDVVDRYGRTPLWHAAATGSLDAVRNLVSLHTSINLTDDLGRSPLHAACRGGHHETVEYLLREGARQTTETSILGLTPLDYAAMFGHAKCVRHLLEFTAQRHAMNPTSQPGLEARNKALNIAASCGWLKCVKVLFAARADPFKSYSYYLKLDVEKSFAMVVEKEGDARVAATEEGHMEIVRYFNTTVPDEERRQEVGDSIPFEYTLDLGRFGPRKAQDLTEAYDDTRTSTQRVGSPQSVSPPQSFTPPQSMPPESLSPLAGYTSLVPYRYSSAPAESYEHSLAAPPSAPFSEKPAIIGSHSATLPAYTSPAYQQMSSESRTSNPRYSFQSNNPYSSFTSSSNQGQTRNSAFSHTAPPRGSPYFGNTSLQLGNPPYPSSGPGYHLERTPQTSTVRANLVHMLGSLGNPSMLLEDPPTDPGTLANGWVPEDEGSAYAITSDGVYELATGDEENIIKVKPCVSALPKITEGDPVGRRKSESDLDAPTSSGSDDLGHQLVSSSIQAPGSWDSLG